MLSKSTYIGAVLFVQGDHVRSLKESNAPENDLLKAISQYIEIDPDAVRIELEKDGRSQRLVADIPLKSTSRHRAG